jgi:hypothetical protein
VVDGEDDLEHGVAVRLARLGVYHLSELRGPARDHALPLLEPLGAASETEARPPP